jgi:hypothetical protein
MLDNRVALFSPILVAQLHAAHPDSVKDLNLWSFPSCVLLAGPGPWPGL